MESLWIKTTKNNEIFEQLNDTKSTSNDSKAYKQKENQKK